MFLSKSLVALLVLSIVGTTVAHPSDHIVRSHHRRHHRPREVARRSSCKARLPPTTAESSSASVATTSVPDNNAAVHTTTTKAEEPSETSASSTQDDEPSSSAAPTKASSSTKQPSSTKASEAPEPTKASSNGGSLSALMPLKAVSSWSMSSKASDAIKLDAGTLRPHNAISELLHPVVTGPDGVKAMQVTYPAGSWNFKQEPRGGMSVYAPGPSSVDLTTAKEATFGYTILFEDGFDFNKGGKLFGLYGGDSESGAVSCSGGRKDPTCFSVRLMWRTGGKGEIYAYLPPTEKANEKMCNVPPESDCNPEYGSSVGRGAWTFTPGKATTVSIRVRLNDVGKANGEMELFADGKSAINVSGLVMRTSEAGRLRGLQMQTFFGGSTRDWASPKTQHTYFRDYTVAITEKL